MMHNDYVNNVTRNTSFSIDATSYTPEVCQAFVQHFLGDARVSVMHDTQGDQMLHVTFDAMRVSAAPILKTLDTIAWKADEVTYAKALQGMYEVMDETDARILDKEQAKKLVHLACHTSINGSDFIEAFQAACVAFSDSARRMYAQDLIV